MAGPLSVLASGLSGAEHIAVYRDGVFVGERSGDIIHVTATGLVEPYASIGERAGQMTVSRKGDLLVAAPDTGHVWSIPIGGLATVYATLSPPLRGIVRAGNGKVYVSQGEQVVEVSSGTPVVVLPPSAYYLPLETLAIGPIHHLLFGADYEITGGAHAIGFPIAADGTLLVAGLTGAGCFGPVAPTGMAFDRYGDLLCANASYFWFLLEHPYFGSILFDPASPVFPGLEQPDVRDVAFGQGGPRGFSRHEVIVLSSDGTTVSRFQFSRPAARLPR